MAPMLTSPCKWVCHLLACFDTCACVQGACCLPEASLGRSACDKAAGTHSGQSAQALRRILAFCAGSRLGVGGSIPAGIGHYDALSPCSFFIKEGVVHAIDELASTATEEGPAAAPEPATEAAMAPPPRRVTRARSKVSPKPQPCFTQSCIAAGFSRNAHQLAEHVQSGKPNHVSGCSALVGRTCHHPT